MRWGRAKPRAAGSRAKAGSAASEDATVLLEDHGGVVLLRSPLDDSLGAADIADLVKGLRSGDGTVTVIAGEHAASSAEFWPRIGELMDSIEAEGAAAVRLALAGAGDDRPDRPAVARRIAEDWGMTVDAPDGVPLAVPGGSLFVPSTAGTRGSWWRFTPDAKPVPLGPRCVPPAWQESLGRLPATTSGGCAVQHIPAGLLVRPPESATIGPGDLYHAVPVHPRRATVVVGVPYGEDVSAEEIAELLAVVPGLAESVRLVPGGLQDLLPLAQRVSDLLDADVEVTTGLPLFAAGRPMDSYAARSVLVGADGAPGWLPFVDSVVCVPRRGTGPASAPRLLRWSPPLPGPGRPEEGVVRLSEHWQVMVTRAGLWVDRRGTPVAPRPARSVLAEGPAIQVGTPGAPLDASLWPAMSRLLAALAPDLRSRATMHVHGVPADGGRELRRLAAQHGLRTIRYATAGLLPRPDAGSLPSRTGGPVPRSGEVARTPAALSVSPPTPGVRPAAGPVPDRPSLGGPDTEAAAVSPGPEVVEPSSASLREGPVRTLAPAPLRPRAVISQRGPLPPLSGCGTSTAADRLAFERLAGPVWERHAEAVDRVLAGLPGLTGEEQDAARGDLIALRAYLDRADDELGYSELAESLRARDARLLPYAACLASALGRMRSYRGAVLRGTGERSARSGSLRPGATLRDLAPVSAVPAGAVTPAPRGARYAVWSVTGRLVRPLAQGADALDEVVFPAGTSFRVLDVRDDGPFPLFLLRELRGPGAGAGVRPTGGEAGERDDEDQAVLARLDMALKKASQASRTASEATPGWPPRCAGRVGEGP